MLPIELDLQIVSDLDIAFAKSATSLIVYLPLPSIGRTNSYIDICSDLIDASWAGERLAPFAQRITVEDDYVEAEYKSRFKLTLEGVNQEIVAALSDCRLIFNSTDEDQSDVGDRYQKLRDTIADFEDAIDDLSPLIPEIVEQYYGNLVDGANYEYRSEAPEFYASQIAKHPERQLGFFRSAYSNRIGASCFASSASWVVPVTVDLDHFFSATDQRYREDELMPGRIFMLEGQSYVLATDEVLHFPMSQYFKGRVDPAP